MLLAGLALVVLPVIHVFADVGDYAGTLDVSDRVEVRARQTENDPRSPAFDVVESATARIGLTDRRWTHFIAYTPVFTAPSIFQSGSEPLLLHTGSIGTSWHDRRVRIALTEDGNYGKQNASLLTGVVNGADAKAPAAQVAGAPVPMSYGLSRTALLTTAQLDRETTMSILASYILQGGLDKTSRTVFPLQYGPRFEVTLGHAVTRTDWLDTSLVAQASQSGVGPCPLIVDSTQTQTCDPAAQLAFVTESWRHRISREVTSSIGAGIGGFRARVKDGEDFQTVVTPIGVASLIYETGVAPQAHTLRLDAQITPIVDVRSGSSDYRAQLVGTATFPSGDTTVTSRLWAMQSVETVDIAPMTLFRGEIEIQQRVTHVLAYGVGIRAEWQHQAPLDPFASGLIYGAVTFTAPTARF